MKTIFSFFMSLVFFSINVSAQNAVNFGSNKQAGKYADINDIKIYYEIYGDGGNTGLELAYVHPEKVKKLVTFGANFTFENFIAASDSVVMDPGDPVFVQTRLFSQRYKDGAKRLSPNSERLPLIKKKLADLMEKYPNFTPDQLGKIKTPTLVVEGDHDLINLNHTAKLFTSLPHAELFVVPGATHLSLVEQPDLINSVVIKFLKTPYRDIDGYYFLKKR